MRPRLNPLKNQSKPVTLNQSRYGNAYFAQHFISKSHYRYIKKGLNFDGLVVTDALDMSGLTLYFNQDEAAVRAFWRALTFC
jgi:hypothetical protein